MLRSFPAGETRHKVKISYHRTEKKERLSLPLFPQFVFHETQKPPVQAACTSFGKIHAYPKNNAAFPNLKTVVKAVIRLLCPDLLFHFPSFPPDSTILCFREKVFLFHSSFSIGFPADWLKALPSTISMTEPVRLQIIIAQNIFQRISSAYQSRLAFSPLSLRQSGKRAA